jgi:hypothetical protein
MIASRWRSARLLRRVRLAVRQDRPQADHHGGPAAGDPDLLPAVQGADLGGQPGAGDGPGDHRATVTAAPGDCKFQFNPVGTAKFTTSCDIATSFLTRNSVPYDVVATVRPAPRQPSRSATRRSNPMTRLRRATRPPRSARRSTRRQHRASRCWLSAGSRRGLVADQKLDAFVAANPEVQARRRRHPRRRKEDGSGREGDQGQAGDGRAAAGAPRSPSTASRRRRLQDGGRSGGA